MDGDLVRRVAELDLAAVQLRFERGLGPDEPYHRREVTALEYRRFLLLALRHPALDVRPGGPVERYWRLHSAHPRFPADRAALTAGTGLDPERLNPPSGGPRDRPPDAGLRDVHRHAFPCGDADLWGWPGTATARRVGAPGLGSVHTGLPDAVDDRTRAALRAEALSLRAGAADGHSAAVTIERGCVSGGGGGFHHADAGPVLHAWHWGGALARRISTVVGTAVVPTGVFYNVHRDGDASPLHNDPFGTELVVLTLLDGPVEPLYLHPELADTPLTEIAALARRTGGHPDGGVAFDVGPGSFLMSGQTIPHHRRPARRDADVVVAAQFFGVLDPG